jgi:ubiquinone/menaquinone biosynthesis C-methylase UbiE
LEILEKGHISTFADVGCAEGFYVKRVASFSDKTFCIGIDIARTYIKKAKMNSETSNTDYVVCDVENLPFRDNSVDVVLCSEVLEHVYHYRESVAELCRVGKKYLVLSFPGHSYIYKIAAKIQLIKKLFDKISPDVGHVSDIEVTEVQELLNGKWETSNLKIGGVLPLKLYKIIPSVRLVEEIDNLLCKVLERFGHLNNVTIHVMKVVKR